MDSPNTSFFVNRVKELEFIIQDIDKDRDHSRFLLVCAKTGIGKTSLIDKAFSNFQTFNIRVSVNIEQAQGKTEGYYFKEFVKTIQASANPSNGVDTLAQFMKNHDFYKGVASGITKTISEYLKINAFIDGYSGEKTVSKLQEWIAGDEEILDICFGYLASIFSKRKVLVAFENFQKIDALSLKLLTNLIETSRRGYFVGEFTITDSESESNNVVASIGARSIDFNRLQITKIDKQELIEAILSEQELVISILQNSYDQSDGNLHKLKLLKQVSSTDNFDVKFDSFDSVTLGVLNNLGSESALVFSQIEIHAGEVSRATLNKSFMLIAKSIRGGIDRYWDIVNELASIGLIKIQRDSIGIGHDSISFEFKSVYEVRKIYPIVARNWVRYYQNMERLPVSGEQEYISILLWQIHFLLKLKSYSEIGEVLIKLSECVSEAPANSIIGYLDIIAGSYKKEKGKSLKDPTIVKWLTIMYYKFGYFDRIVDMLDAPDLDEPIVFLCYSSAASSMKSRQLEVLDQIRSIKGYTNESFKLALTLVEIRTLRSSYQLIEAEQLWRRHYVKDTFSNTPFEKGFLQYVSLVIHDDFELRRTCLKRALTLFKESNNLYGTITTLNTLARDSVYTGNIELSGEYLREAQSISSKTAYPRHQQYNNLSVLEIFKNEVTELTKERLKNALRICTNVSDQLIISSNLLCLAIAQKDHSYGFRTYQKIYQDVTESFDDKDLITQICLFNCFKYAIMTEETEQAEYILKKYFKKTVFYRHRELWEYLLNQRDDHTMNYDPPKDFYPTFIIDWEIDFHSALDNSQ